MCVCFLFLFFFVVKTIVTYSTSCLKFHFFCFRRFERMTPALPAVAAAAAAATAASFPGFLFLFVHTLSRHNCSISELR